MTFKPSDAVTHNGIDLTLPDHLRRELQPGSPRLFIPGGPREWAPIRKYADRAKLTREREEAT